MDSPIAFLFFILTAISSIHPGSCYKGEDLDNAEVAIGIVYLITIILFLATAVISGVVISCYICKCCPVAQRQRQEGTILSLPQHGGPMAAYPLLASRSDYPGPPQPAPPYYSAGHQQETPFPLEVKESHSNY
jgi:hypothetical protein